MQVESEEQTTALLRRWKRKVKSESELGGEVRDAASRLLSGVRLFVEERQCRLVERIVVEATLVRLAPETPAYVV